MGQARQEPGPAAQGAVAVKEKRTGLPKGVLYIICLISAVVFMLTAWVISMMTGGIEVAPPINLLPPQVGAVGPDDPEQDDGSLDVGSTAARREGVYTFLVVGVDKIAANTDTMLLMTFDTKAGNLNVLQIPRDTRLNVNRSVRKINASYAYNGIEGLKEDVTKLLGVPIDRHAIISTTAFRKLVDTVGGVEVTIPSPGMYYSDPEQGLSINLSPGTRTLMGADAEGFVRFRHGYDDADIGRLKAQKAFISSLMKKLLTPAMITKAPQFIQIAFENLKTDMKMEDFVYLGTQATKLSAESIAFFTLPGEELGADWGIYKEETIEIINTSFNPYTVPIDTSRFDIVTFKRKYTTEVDTSGTGLEDAVDTKLSAIKKRQSTAKTPETTPDSNTPSGNEANTSNNTDSSSGNGGQTPSTDTPQENDNQLGVIDPPKDPVEPPEQTEQPPANNENNTNDPSVDDGSTGFGPIG